MKTVLCIVKFTLRLIIWIVFFIPFSLYYLIKYAFFRRKFIVALSRSGIPECDARTLAADISPFRIIFDK